MHLYISQTRDGCKINWMITEIFSFINYEENCYESPKFYFANTSWRFRMNPESSERPGFVSFYLFKKKLGGHSVDYSIAMKKLRGSEESLAKGILKGDENSSDPCYPMTVSELQLFSFKILTFTCTLELGTTISPPPSVLNRPKLKKLTNINGLSRSFKGLFADKESCDTTLRVKEKEYQVHKAVLVARSSVFFAMFHNDMIEKQTSTITIPDCDPESFHEFLEYLYCGELKVLSFSSALHMYSTSNKYDVQDLKAFCVECLIQSLTVENIFQVVIMADLYDDTKLFTAVQDFYNRNSLKILFTGVMKCSSRDRMCVCDHCLAIKILKEM